MTDYILKRPMLLCGIMCIIISVVGFYSRTALLVLGIFYTVLLGALILIKAKPQTVLVFFMAFIMLISTVFTLGKAEKMQRFDGDTYTADAVVCEITRKTSNYHSAVFQIADRSVPINNAKILAFYNPHELEIGQAITAEFKLESVQDSIYKASNFSDKVYLTANLKNIKPCDSKNDFVLLIVGKTRNYIRKTLFSNLGFSEASTLCALVFGDKDYFTNEFSDSVSASGVSHVMVVSGMHLSILVILCTRLGDRFYYNRYLKALTMVAVVLILTCLCGFSMSILRAGLTYIIAAFALVLKRDNTSPNTLGAATSILLICSPFAIFSIALQLSLLSTFGILCVALPIIDYCSNREIIKSNFLKLMFSLALITVSATVLTLPVTISVFGYVSVVGVITNLLIGYAVTLALSLAVCALIINLLLPFLAKLLFIPCGVIVTYINSVIKLLGNLPFSTVSLPRWTAILSIILIIIIFWILLACKNRIDMIKLNEMRQKIEKEGGKQLKWQ